MNPRLQASLLWGVVGMLTFLVGIQGYHLLGDEFVGLGVGITVTLAVGVVTTGLVYLVRPRVIRWQSR